MHLMYCPYITVHQHNSFLYCVTLYVCYIAYEQFLQAMHTGRILIAGAANVIAITRQLAPNVLIAMES